MPFYYPKATSNALKVCIGFSLCEADNISQAPHCIFRAGTKKSGTILGVFEPESLMGMRNPRREPQRCNYTHFAQGRPRLLIVI